MKNEISTREECVEKLSTASSWIGVHESPDWSSRVRYQSPHNPVVSKTSEAVSRSERVCAFYSTRAWSKWWWREERWTSRESLWLPAIGTWRYPIQAYKRLVAMSVLFPVCNPDLIPVYLKNSGPLLFSGKWNGHSCAPSPLAPDPIRVQSCVCCLFWTNRNRMTVTSIFLSISLSNQSYESFNRRFSKWKYFLLLKVKL